MAAHLRAPLRSAALELPPELPPELSRLLADSLHVFGPVVASQCDHAGVPIQRYVTIVAAQKGGRWLLRRMVTNLNDGSEAAPVVDAVISEGDARRWIADNQVALESRTP